MSIIQQLEDLKEWSQDSTRYERRLNFRGGQLVQPGPGRQGYQGDKVKPVLYKITSPHHPETGKWAYKRSDNPIMYFNTKKEAEHAKKISKILQYESMERPTTGVFQKKVKKLLDEGLTKKQTAKNLGVNFKVVDRAIEEGNIKWKFEPYINVPKNLNYIKKNYGKKSRETMAKELFQDKEMPMSTKESRVGKLSQKLFDTGELKPTRGPTKEHAKKHGYYKDPEHEIVARVKKAKRDAVKARSVESIETAYSGTKKTQLSHMDDIYSQFTTGETLGYAPDKINQEFLRPYDNKMKSLYKKRDRLLKEKPKDLIKQLEQINKTGARLAGETGGYKSFKFVDPYTLKPYQFGVDAAKTIDPLGILEGKTIQETSIPADPTVKRSRQILDLSPVDRYFFEKNRKAVLASQKKVTKDFLKLAPKKSLPVSYGLSSNLGAVIDDALKANKFKGMRNLLKGELAFAAADFVNNLTKGQSVEKAFQKAVEMASFDIKDLGADERALIKHATEQGASEEEVGALRNYLNYMKKYKNYERANKMLEYAKKNLGEGTGSPEDIGTTWEDVTSARENLKLREKEMSDLQATYEEGFEGTPDMQLGNNMLTKYMNSLAAEEWNKTAGTLIDRGARPKQGEGIIWGGVGALARDIGAIATGKMPTNFWDWAVPAQIDPWSKDEKQIRIMERPAVGVEYPEYQQALEDMKYDLGYALPEQNYAGGGIANVRRPWAIPPVSGPVPQGGGLSSQFNRVKKLTE